MATNKIKDVLQKALSINSDQAFKQDVYYLAQKVFSLSLEELLTNGEQEVDDLIFIEYLNRYINKEPLYYILEEAPFYGRNFYVNQNVLIPRNETEELVLFTLKYVKNNKFSDPSILDVGSGSGCIAITLNLEINNSKVSSVDISPLALEVAKENNKRLSAKVNFYQSDCLKEVIKRKERYQIIVSNPPYIDRDSFVEESVLKYEPHLALFAENKGLSIIEKIIDDIDKVLLEKGMAIFEISPEQEKSLKEMVNVKLPSYEIEFLKDINSFTRFMILKK